MITLFHVFFKWWTGNGQCKFTFGFNGIEFTHDALIKYQAMTCGSTLLHIFFFCKFEWSVRADSGLVLLGAL